MENTYHCSWNIYGQSISSRIFLDSIDMIAFIPYSFIDNYFIFMFAYITMHILLEKRLGFNNKIEVYHNTKVLSFFDYLKPWFHLSKYITKVSFIFKSFESYCLKLWMILSEQFRFLTFFEGLSRWLTNFFSLGKGFPYDRKLYGI